MAPKEGHPVTQAIRVLRQKKAVFTLRPYRYEEKGGTGAAARELGVDEHQVIKTLVMEDERSAPLLVLMHVESSILHLPVLLVNAGKRGLLAEIDPGELERVLNPIPVEVAI